jgi:hypothetical protein
LLKGSEKDVEITARGRFIDVVFLDEVVEQRGIVGALLQKPHQLLGGPDEPVGFSRNRIERNAAIIEQQVF